MTHQRHRRVCVVAVQTDRGPPFHWSHFLAVIGEGWRGRGRNNETTRVHHAAWRRGRRLAGSDTRAAARQPGAPTRVARDWAGGRALTLRGFPARRTARVGLA